MPAQVPTVTGKRHVLGDLVERFYTFTAVGDGDTFNVPQDTIQQVQITPTTAAAVGATWAAASTGGQTITFHSGGAWTGVVRITTRKG